MPLTMEKVLSTPNLDQTYSDTEYRQRFMSPRRDDYAPNVALPKIGMKRSESSRAFLSFDCKPDAPSTSSEYRLCYENYHPKRPYCYHAQPSHVFDHVPKPLDNRRSARLASSSLIAKDTEYQERFPNYPSFIPVHALMPPHLPANPNTQSETQLKRDRMSRSQYFHELITESDKFNSGRAPGTSEQRNAFQWPFRPSRSSQKLIQEKATPTYQPYYVPRNIYEPLPTVQRSTLNDTL